MAASIPSVAIIGGGISGLVCAARLGQLGLHNTTVFDTGKNSVGGRSSSRDVVIGGRVCRFDHSCQYFTVSDPKFAKIVSYLHKSGAVHVWKGPVGRIGKSHRFEKNPENTQCFIGTNGMRSVAECLEAMVNVRRPVWIAHVNWEPSMKKWRVAEEGFFDYLVIAHNGKCADRLMASAGAPDIHSLLQVRFSDRVSLKDKKMTLSSLWVLLVAFPRSLGLEFEGAHIDHDPDVSWVANNTAKLQQEAGALNAGKGKQDTLECWTVISTNGFGKANKVPQEMIPQKKSAEVIEKLLVAFSRVTGVQRQKLTPSYSHVQLWGAAVPLNTLHNKERCIFDGFRQVGVCGDWLVSPCIQGAALSGLDLAEKIHLHSTGKAPSTSLAPDFLPVQGGCLGSFPTDAKMIFRPGDQPVAPH